jgi:hypothetical protein
LNTLGFRGKLLVIDFWADWCAPCRSLLPELDSLQARFGGRVQFLPVSDEGWDKLGPVVSALGRGRRWRLPFVVRDSVLGRLFPHHALPHEVWVGPDGKVLAVTESSAVTAANVERVLAGAAPLAEEKADLVVPYAVSQPLLLGGNGDGGSGVSALRYHALLSAYLPGLDGGVNISDADSVRGQKFNARNVPLLWLYRLAFSHGRDWFPDARVRLLTRDSGVFNSALSGQAYFRWLAAGHGWCYELLVPPALAPGAFGLMQADLGRLFPAYAAVVETRRVRSLALVRTDSVDRLRSAGGGLRVEVGPYGCELRNANLEQLMLRLGGQYLQHSVLPLVDATGYTGKVDLSLHASLGDVAALNAELLRYGLQLREQDSEVRLLVIRDAVSKGGAR